MYRFIKRNGLKIVVGFSFCLYLLSIVITKIDVDFNFRWAVFWIYIASICSVVFIYLKKCACKSFIRKSFNKKEVLSFGLIIILVELVSFYLIQAYPFVSVGDGVRDAGLDAVKIANGTIKDLFAYGNYNGYGHIIPAFSSFFYRFFGNSVLTYRFPATIISCVDVVVIYLLLRFATQKKFTAFIGAMVLTTLPLHLFFPRIELVVIFDSFWTSILLLSFYLWLKKKTAINYILFGTVLGMACQYHTPVRIVSLLLLAIALFIEIKSVWKNFNKRKIVKKVKNLLLLLIFCFVGFGPTILYSNSNTFLQRDRFVYTNENDQENYFNKANTISTIKNNYMKSLMVLVYEPTTSRYPDSKPILTPFLALLFLIGVGYSFFVLKNSFYNSLIVLVLILPFTNSAMTDWVNADHRLAPLLPITAIFIALGVSWVIKQVRNKPMKKIIAGIIVLYLLFQIFYFFSYLPGNKDKNIKDYLSMHIIYFLQSKDFSQLKTTNTTISSSRLASNVCIFLSTANYQNLELLHYKEQYEYFVPSISLDKREDDKIGDNEAYIFKGVCPEDYQETISNWTTSCTSVKNLRCPLGYLGDIIIYY